MSKFTLFSLLASKGLATFQYAGNWYVLQSIEREDGSGSSFNVKVKTEDGADSVLYIRTID